MKTKNLHEVKHWIEPGEDGADFSNVTTTIPSFPELVNLGWGHEVSQYEYGQTKNNYKLNFE